MGELPQARVHPSLPFERSGVDYAGPINARLTKTRGKGTMKGYIAIFMCMATCMFTARRGHCKEL